METRSNQALPIAQHTGQISSVKADYSHIQLTDEEIAAAIHAAKAKKDAELRMEQYKRRLFEKPVYQQLTYDELDAMVREKYSIVDVSDADFATRSLEFRKNGITPFILDDNNRTIYEQLCQYFTNDEAFELSGEYKLSKGILLRGPIGCGKTSLMQMFKVNSFRPFEVFSCRVIADNYSKNGPDALYHFSSLQAAYSHQNFGHKEIGICYDDLGTESSKKNFGNEVNVMQDILYKLYDQKNFGFFHCTTNLGSDNIEEIYGDRVISRIYEMYNVISYPSTAKDWRKR
jgi:hypothetical protein